MSSPHPSSPHQKTLEFLKTGDLYRLGSLVTESPNPRTHGLSSLCQTRLSDACDVFKNVELDALESLLGLDSLADEVVESFDRCLTSGGRIFLSGCGATGRLSLVLESIWRQSPRPGFADTVIAFTAGGDYALVRSLGIFEDRPDLGARHLLDLGFRSGDMLVAITEGGETPFVLGTLDQAVKTSPLDSWLFFCNPPDLLKKKIERSRLALENPSVRWHSFNTGPMALTGSTRLQASTVLMAFVGACLRETASGQKNRWIFSELIDRTSQMAAQAFAPLIEIESEAHARGAFTLHRTRSAAMPVLTDTTERAPTFSLAPFESTLEIPKDPSAASRTYLEIPRAIDSRAAWHHLLRRDPRPFAAPQGMNIPAIDHNGILAFDFSDGVIARRTRYGVKTETILDVEFGEDLHLTSEPSLVFRAEGPRGRAEVIVPSSHDPLIRQVQMKYALNLQSTLAMGRIGRFHGNLMTYVRPTNGKLIDRALRTLRALALERAEKENSSALRALTQSDNDEPFLDAIFKAMDSVLADEPVAIKALSLLRP